jgi:hypothetical protein
MVLSGPILDRSGCVLVLLVLLLVPRTGLEPARLRAFHDGLGVPVQ